MLQRCSASVRAAVVPGRSGAGRVRAAGAGSVASRSGTGAPGGALAPAESDLRVRFAVAERGVDENRLRAVPPLVGKAGFQYRFELASQVMAAGA